MTTTRRPIIDLMLRKVSAVKALNASVTGRVVARLDRATLNLEKHVDPYGRVWSDYLPTQDDIAMGNRELDAAEEIRRVDLASLENFASQSLGPIDPRIIGRRSDGTAIFR